MPQIAIAGTFGGKCFERGISIMRLVLGYDSALPSSWLCCIPPITHETLDLLGVAFPRHDIKVWHSDEGLFEGARHVHWEYMGSRYKTTEESDNWLTAFSYGYQGNPRGHFVIGEPIIYGDSYILLYTVAVSLETENVTD